LVAKPDGGMVTGRQEPRLVLVESHVNQEHLSLSAPGIETLNIAIPKNTSNIANCR